MSLLFDAFRAVVADRGSQPGIWSRGEGLRHDLGQVAARVEDWRRELAKTPDGPVALATGNVAAFPELFLALRALGRAVVVADGSLPLAEKLRIVRRLGVPHLLHRHGGSELSAAGPQAEHRLLGGAFTLTRIRPEQEVEPPAGTALVKLTSGSTGDPVGVCLSDEALLAGIRQIAAAMGIRPRDRVLVAIPLSHSYGFDNGVLSLAVLGTPLVLEPRFFPAPLLAALAEGEATVFPLVPPLARSLAESAWPADLPLRTVLSAGGRLAPEVAERFHGASGRHIHQFYGSTETGGICYETRPADPASRDTVGQPLPGVRVALGEDGRVRVASAANSGGTFGLDRALAAREIATGDLAEWTPEGRLRLVGRAADFLNVGGRKVLLPAVEETLRGVEGVREVAVVGLEDAARGDRLVAFVVAPGGFPATAPLPWGLAARDVRVVDRLPYTERGKLDRRALVEMASGRGR